jgi:predicted RNA-binding protein YlqC (UPF0109 family)
MSGARDLCESLVRDLAGSPDDVQVTEVADGPGTATLELRLAPGDVGRVIGRGGRTIRALRTVVRAAGMREGVRTSVEIIDGGE